MPRINLNNTPNAQMIKNVQEKSVTRANAKTVQDIPVDLIDENPDNSVVFNMEKIQKLAENIKLEGFFGTIEVYQKKDGRYEISSGHRRFRAVKLLGYKTIPATVSEMPELDTQRRRKLIASNINSRNMKPLDWARAMNYYAETLLLEDAASRGKKYVPGQKYRAEINVNEKTAEYFDTGELAVIRYRSLCKLIPDLQTMIEDEIFPWTSIWEVGNMSEEHQLNILNEIKKTISFTPSIETEEVGEDGKPVKKVFLSGVQVSAIVRKYKQALENEKREQSKPEIKEEIPKEKAPIDDQILRSLPIYNQFKVMPSEPDTEISEETNMHISTIDNLIVTIEREFSSLVKREYSISDKALVKSSIESLEKILEELKKQL